MRCTKVVKNGSPVFAFVRRVLAISIILFLVWFVDFRALGTALANLTWESILLLLLMGVVLVYVSAFKWALFLRASGQSVRVSELCGLYLVGYFVNLILPSYLGGDLVRSYELGKRVGQHSALAATILERFTGLVAMVFLGLITMSFVDGIPIEVQVTIICVALGLVLASIVALSRSVLAVVESRMPVLHPVIAQCRKLQEALRVGTSKPDVLFKAFLLSFLFHSLTVVNTQIAAYAVGWSGVDGLALFVVLPLILLIGAIPVTPQGLGLQEGAFAFFLHLIGASPAQALGVGVVLRAKSYLLALLGGAFWGVLKMRERGERLSDRSSV